jgi:hypothetical protein
MNLDNYTIDELVKLKNEITSKIYSFEDGYFYICNVRSYGRNWKDKSIKNPHTLQELCYQYFGEDGIVDVYTNNPDLNIENYGEVRFIPTEKDFENWENHQYLKNFIPHWESDLIQWENRDNLPFRERPTFEPMFSADDIEKYKKEMSDLEGTFVEPVNLKKYSDDEEE